MRILDFRSLLQGSRARSVPCVVNLTHPSVRFTSHSIFVAVERHSEGSL
jgi:hypothetical protein